MKIGVLALQGAFAAHQAALEAIGVAAPLVRRAPELADVDALVIPGGESTTMSKLLDTTDLVGPLGERLAAGMPTFGTCAGMILLASTVIDGRADQHALGAIDIDVVRNGYGRQLQSFEADLKVTGLETAFRGVFIRAPKVARVGSTVETLSEWDGVSVLLRSGPTMVASFHPELSGDPRVHRLFVQLAASYQ